MQEDLEKTKLQRLEIDIENPLSTIDWQNFSAILDEVKGLGWI
jgi:hypothetical protein